MRILRVSHRLNPPDPGGSANHASILSAYQTHMGHRVVVLTSKEGPYPEHEWRDGYEVYRFPAWRPLTEYPITLTMIGKLIECTDSDFDIIHALNHLFFPTNLSAVRRKIGRIPLTISTHGFRVQRGRLMNFAQDMYLSSVGRWTLKAADYVTSFTERERQQIVRLGISEARTCVMPNGVDSGFFHPKHTTRIPGSVLWAGRFVPEKCVDQLIQAAALVIKKRTDACFKLVGYGPELRNLEKLATTLGVNKNVEFTGPATKRELLELYNTSSVFVLPSLSEGFPNTVLEAMACGTPVIVTSGIGLEEVVATAGLYVPPREPVQLSDMILKILDNEEIAHELGHRARQRAEIYDWRGIVEQTNALYERIISSREAD